MLGAPIFHPTRYAFSPEVIGWLWWWPHSSGVFIGTSFADPGAKVSPPQATKLKTPGYTASNKSLKSAAPKASHAWNSSPATPKVLPCLTSELHKCRVPSKSPYARQNKAQQQVLHVSKGTPGIIAERNLQVEYVCLMAGQDRRDLFVIQA